MNLYYYLGPDGKRVYTLEKQAPDGTPTIPVHPARFTPSDTNSKHRITIKKRFNLLPTQQQGKEY